jgi:hypothetical protein
VRKSLRFTAVAAVVAALGVIAAAPASAGKPAPGGVYKGEYVWSGMSDKMRIKVYESGTGGNVSLKCAGVNRAKFDINNRGKFKIQFGADAVLVEGKGKFGSKGRVRGEIDSIDTNGAECDAPGEFALVLADV